MFKNTFVIAALIMSSTAFAGKTISAGGFQTIAAAKINFVSIGSGIDHTLKNKVDRLIRKHQAQNLVEQYTQANMGFEGEVSICVKLNDFDAAFALNTKLEELVSHGKYTTIEFDSSCYAEPAPTGPFELAN